MNVSRPRTPLRARRPGLFRFTNFHQKLLRFFRLPQPVFKTTTRLADIQLAQRGLGILDGFDRKAQALTHFTQSIQLGIFRGQRCEPDGAHQGNLAPRFSLGNCELSGRGYTDEKRNNYNETVCSAQN